MDKRLVLVFAAMLLAPLTALAAEQCVLYKGRTVGTTYDVLTYAGLKNAPHRIDAYTDHTRYALIFAGDTVYGYNKVTKSWEVAKISAAGYPKGVTRIDSVMYHALTDVTTIISGENYWYRLGEVKMNNLATGKWYGPVKLYDVANAKWNIRPAGSPLPKTADVATTFRYAKGGLGDREQLYIAKNSVIDGKAGVQQWYTSGTKNSYTWNYSFMPYAGFLSADMRAITNIGAVGQIGALPSLLLAGKRYWLMFVQGECVGKIPYEELKPIVADIVENLSDKVPDVVIDNKKCTKDKDCKSMGGCDAGCWNLHFNPIYKKGTICPTIAGPEYCACVNNVCTAAEPEVVRGDKCSVTYTESELKETAPLGGLQTTYKVFTILVDGKPARLEGVKAYYENFMNTSDTVTDCSVNGNVAKCLCTKKEYLKSTSSTYGQITAIRVYLDKSAYGCPASVSPKVGSLQTQEFTVADGDFTPCDIARECVDSDSGKDADVAGTCHTIVGTGTEAAKTAQIKDVCSGNTMTEYYCGDAGYCVSEQKQCKEYCGTSAAVSCSTATPNTCACP